MTFSHSASNASFVSPFLLPYIVADKEDLERLSHTALEGGLVEPIMHSPLDERVWSLQSSKSVSEELNKTVPSSPSRSSRNSSSPKRKDTSPRPIQQSVLEASISELTFDPDLTFMDSPPVYSSSEESPTRLREQAAQLNVTLPVFDATMKPVPPDRTVIPIDASEIGFSNSLKASLQRDKANEPASKRSRTTRALPPPKSEPAPTSDPGYRKAGSSNQGKEIVKPAKQVKKKTEVQNGEEISRTARASKQEPADQQTPNRGKRTKPVDAFAESKTGLYIGLDNGNSIRKSPRFASKVIVGNEAPQLLSCKICHKSYKRVRDYEKHIGSCK